jgi:hypothetical protein
VHYGSHGSATWCWCTRDKTHSPYAGHHEHRCRGIIEPQKDNMALNHIRPFRSTVGYMQDVGPRSWPHWWHCAISVVINSLCDVDTSCSQICSMKGNKTNRNSRRRVGCSTCLARVRPWVLSPAPAKQMKFQMSPFKKWETSNDRNWHRGDSCSTMVTIDNAFRW